MSLSPGVFPAGRGARNMGGDGISMEWGGPGGLNLGGGVNVAGKAENGTGGEAA